MFGVFTLDILTRVALLCRPIASGLQYAAFNNASGSYVLPQASFTGDDCQIAGACKSPTLVTCSHQISRLACNLDQQQIISKNAQHCQACVSSSGAVAQYAVDV